MRRVCGDATAYAADGDAHDLAEKIRELLDDSALRLELGEKGRRLVEDRLSWPTQVPTLLAAVERAVELRSGRGVPASQEEQTPERALRS
jgi:glycosyltransferase involved in cell wall biosynthesis